MFGGGETVRNGVVTGAGWTEGSLGAGGDVSFVGMDARSIQSICRFSSSISFCYFATVASSSSSLLVGDDCGIVILVVVVDFLTLGLSPTSSAAVLKVTLFRVCGVVVS